MQCPSCSETIDDDAAICEHCDAVVDPSAFDDSPRPSKPAAKRPPKAPVKRKPAGKRPVGTKPKRVPREAPAEAAAPRDESPAGDWRSRVDAEDWNQMPGGQAPEVFTPDKGIDPDDFIGGVRLFVESLSIGDKLALFGAAGTIVACFFPWRETIAEGDVLGLLGPGIVTFLMAVGTITALTLRANRSMKNELLLWAAQLGTIAFGVLWAFIAIQQSWNPTLARAVEGNQEVWVSKPGFGVILAVLTGGVSALGSVLGLKGKG